jgi:hypothetical protein
MEEISTIRHRLILAAVTFLLLASFNIRAQQADEVLRAGVARIDITPKEPVMLSGYASRKDLSKGVHDPLSARVVAFENNGKRLVLVSTDLIGYYDGTAEDFRKAILAKFKLQPSELFLAGIHTHAAPTLTVDKDKGHENNLKYTETLKDRLLKVIGEALDSTAPVRIGCGIGYSPVGSNRREVHLDDPGRPKDEAIKLGRNPYGPTDKQVLVAKIANADGAPVAVLLDYATHGTSLGPQNYQISGDVLGLAEQFVEKILGPDVIAPAFAGASGDIDPWYRILPEFNSEPGWIPEPVLLGTLLGEEVVHVYRDIKETSAAGKIDTAFITMALPRKPGDEPDDKTNEQSAALNIIAGRVGDIGFIGFGCEMCCEIGMAIKAASPFKHTFVITHCNGAAGYLPTKGMHIEGGYEVQSSPFAPQAAEMVIKHSLKMLYRL